MDDNGKTENMEFVTEAEDMSLKREETAAATSGESPPSPPPARKLARRSTLAIARRLSRASVAVGLSLEEQLEIVPSAEEAATAERLNQVLNLCMRASVRSVEEMFRDADDHEDLEASARIVSNQMRQKVFFNADEIEEMAKQLDASLLTVRPEDLLSSNLKAIRDYTARLAQEEQDWNSLIQERKAQHKNSLVNHHAAKVGKMKVDDLQKFNLSPSEKAFFNRLPDISADCAKFVRHEEQKALKASSLALAAKRLKLELEQLDRDLAEVAHQLGEQARQAQGTPVDPRDLIVEASRDVTPAC